MLVHVFQLSETLGWVHLKLSPVFLQKQVRKMLQTAFKILTNHH